MSTDRDSEHGEHGEHGADHGLDLGTDHEGAAGDGHLLFGGGAHDHDHELGSDHDGGGRHAAAGGRRAARRAHHEEHRRRRLRRRGRVFLALGAVIIVAIGVAGFFVIRNLISTPDYSGQGAGTVTVVIHDGDSASDIADTLKKAGVVKSAEAFTDAAKNNSASSNLQPGVYTLRKHMSGANALQLLLSPSARAAEYSVLIPEGATKLDVAASIAKALKIDVAQVTAAMNDTSQLSLPSTYATANQPPRSVEGFLYPATYSVEPGSSPMDVLNTMITNYAAQDRKSGFADDAGKHKINAYEMLTIASIAQSEAKFPADMAKVARVILNRLAKKMPLQIDATSAYGAKLQGLDPTKIIFAELDSPYNSYTHDGLPPTPISNPGAEALTGAADPANGNWLYYVNADAAGHLFFTDSETAFAAAAAKCKAQGWGCG